ncbi:MAG TPA: hypothetical protein VI197_21790 [Polyangiaceae bacterium]
MKKIIYSFWVTATAFGLVGACGGDSSDPTTSPTTSTTSPMTSTTSPITGTTSPTTTVSGTGGVTSTAGTSTTGSVSDCTLTTAEGLAPDVAQVPAAQGVYSYGDGVTTACLSSPAANQVCLEGLGALAGDMYENYGAGLGIQLAVTDPAEEAWDATADGVVGVKFSIVGPSTSAPVRVGVTMVGLTDNGFVTNEGGITAPGEQTLLFADLVQPSWSMVEEAFDATKIHSLQFQLVTAQAATRPYDFCVSGITWIDANGNAVDLPWGTGGGAGGAGGEGGGAGAAP